MSLLLDLPDDLCKEFFSEWLNIAELILLDSAFCSIQWRTQFLSFLPFVSGLACSRDGCKILEWMANRGIEVKEIIVDSELTGAEWLAALSPHWKNLKSLDISDEMEEFIPYINTCTKLERLIISGMFDAAALNGKILTNVTDLQYIIEEEFDPLLVLGGIYENCRLLKTFHYTFSPTENSTPLLMNIIKENEDIVSLGIEVDEDEHDSVLHQLAALRGRTLTELHLQGRADFGSLTFVLKNFNRIDTVGLLIFLDGSFCMTRVCYVRSKQSLTLQNVNKLTGWKEFAALLTDLREIQLNEHTIQSLILEGNLCRTVQILEIDCIQIKEKVLKILLRRCVALKRFSLKSKKAINWPDVLTNSNIKKLSIRGPNDHAAYLLTACHHLTEVTFADCVISRDMIPSLVEAIRSYRHATTGQSIWCSCEFYSGNNNKTIRYLNYHDSKFSGSLWDEYGSLIEVYTREIDDCKSIIKDLVAGIEALKEQLEQEQQINRSVV